MVDKCDILYDEEANLLMRIICLMSLVGSDNFTNGRKDAWWWKEETNEKHSVYSSVKCC